MAFPTPINNQITDAVTQANAAHNATSAQQQAAINAQAATTMEVTTLYAMDTASDGIATSKILGS